MKILIINIGPYGDVLRTTILLNEYKNEEVYWMTSKKNKSILKTNLIKKLYFIENINNDIFEINFDLVISLNEEWCDITKSLKYEKLIGVFKRENKIDYTKDSSYWFDMSLVSKLGNEEANRLKKENRLSYNQILIEMIGKKWEEQKYILDIEKKEGDKIGLIKDVDGVFKSKKWNHFDQLYEKLKKDGYKVEFLEIRNDILEHIKDINDCFLIVCPDTFGMHAGISLEKKIISLFNSTSPHEIYSYNHVIKIISDFYEKYFYTKDYNKELCNSIDVQEVYETIKRII